MENVILPSGQIINMHSKEECSGNCPVHNSSQHHMKNWELYWRDDRGIFERICPHGIGHPDPDTLAYIGKTKGDEAAQMEAVHGCDDCCLVRKRV